MEKRPRQYAAEIAALKTIEERREALSSVPQHLQALVKDHLMTEFSLRRYLRR